MNADELWDHAATAVRKEINVGTWQSTFSNVEAASLNADVLTLRVPNAIVREKLDGRYRSLLEEAVTEAAGHSVAIDFEQSTPTLFDVDDLTVGPDRADAGSDRSSFLNGGVLDLTTNTANARQDELDVVFPSHRRHRLLHTTQSVVTTSRAS